MSASMIMLPTACSAESHRADVNTINTTKQSATGGAAANTYLAIAQAPLTNARAPRRMVSGPINRISKMITCKHAIKVSIGSHSRR